LATSWKLVGNPGCQPGLATSFQLVGCGLNELQYSKIRYQRSWNETGVQTHFQY